MNVGLIERVYLTIIYLLLSVNLNCMNIMLSVFDIDLVHLTCFSCIFVSGVMSGCFVLR